MITDASDLVFVAIGCGYPTHERGADLVTLKRIVSLTTNSGAQPPSVACEADREAKGCLWGGSSGDEERRQWLRAQ